MKGRGLIDLARLFEFLFLKQRVPLIEQNLARLGLLRQSLLIGLERLVKLARGIERIA